MTEETRDPIRVMADVACQRKIIDVIKRQLDEQTENLHALEDELGDAMKVRQIKTQDGYGLRATMAVRTDSKIVDPAEVEAALVEIGRRDEAIVTKLDPVVVKRIAKERGELLPGMAATETEYLSVKAVEA